MNLSKEVVTGTLQLNLERASFTRQNQLVFSGFTWQWQLGEQWAIYGPVGSGKTTLLAALNGQLPLQSGKFELKIQEGKGTSSHILNRTAFRDNTAFVSFQQLSYFNYGKIFYQQRYQSLESEVAVPSVQDVLTQVTPDILPSAIEKITRLMQLQDLLPVEVIRLSNGQTRKLQIARALLQKPKLLVLDNPFTGLDENARHQLKAIIDDLIEQGTQVLLAINQPELPEKITHVLWLNNFSMQGTYTRNEFFEVLRTAPSSIIDAEANIRLQEPIINLLPKANNNYRVAVQMEHVRVRYQDKIILNNISWIVNKGEKWALIGPNGSGKSTLLSLIYADNPQAFANKIILFDRRKGSGESIWDIKKRIGFVSPELHMYFRQSLTGQEVAATGFTDTLTRPRQLTEEQLQLIQEHFAFFNQSDLLIKSFLQLSAGEQRLILLIRSLIKNPDLIIWDEPFQGLSPEYRKQATALLKSYCTDATSLILVSHYAHEIPAFVSNYVYLEGGQVKSIIRN